MPASGSWARWSTLLAPLLVDFAGLGDAGRVFDVGSGTGALAVSIAKLRGHCAFKNSVSLLVFSFITMRFASFADHWDPFHSGRDQRAPTFGMSMTTAAGR